MSRAMPFTLLSLSEYARFLQLNPLHFAGGISTLVPGNACSDVWKQWSWQDDGKISREQVAQLIQDAERTLTEYLGYWPAPVWIEDERKPYTRPFDPTFTGNGFDVRGRYKSMQLNYGKVLYGGRRATTLLGTPTYVLRDFDGDGFTETAVFTVLNVPSTLDICEVKMYFKVYNAADAANCRTDPSSTGADFAWEIRPIRATLSATTLTIYVSSWELFKPQLQEGFATIDIDADDLTTPSYVDRALVYREYNDPTTPVQFLWASDIYCDDTAGDCAWITQNGCMRLSSPRLGLATLSPATYNATTGLFDAAVWSQGYEPDGVRLWYRAGATEATSSCLVLDRFWADTIAMLATARLNFPICSCSDMAQIVSSKWTTDLAEMTENSTFQTSSAVLQCPFGTRAGEVEAWRRVQKRAAGKAVIT